VGKSGARIQMNCPHCGKRINVGKLLRSKRPTPAQKEAARLNGAKGGRPKKPSARTPNAELSDAELRRSNHQKLYEKQKTPNRVRSSELVRCHNWQAKSKCCGFFE
jgi:hypothetical protein